MFTQKIKLTLLTFVFSVFISYLSLININYNWDVLGYIASAKSQLSSDVVAIHSHSYLVLKEAVTTSQFEKFIQSEPYRRVMYEDVNAFNQQLPFYQIRIAYVSLIRYLSQLGVNPAIAAGLISVFSVISGYILLVFTFKDVVRTELLFVFPFITLATGLLDVSRATTADGLAFLGVALLVFLYLNRFFLVLLILMPLCVLIRTDLIIFATLLYVALYFRISYLRKHIILSFIGMLGVYIGINQYYGNYGWKTLFYVTFVERLTEPAEANIALSIKDYLDVFVKGILSAPYNLSLMVFISFIGVPLILFWKIYCQSILQSGNISKANLSYDLLLISILYVVSHFVLFPALWIRFFAAHYMLGILCSMVLLSSALSKRKDES